MTACLCLSLVCCVFSFLLCSCSSLLLIFLMVYEEIVPLLCSSLLFYLTSRNFLFFLSFCFQRESARSLHHLLSSLILIMKLTFAVQFPKKQNRVSDGYCNLGLTPLECLALRHFEIVCSFHFFPSIVCSYDLVFFLAISFGRD